MSGDDVIFAIVGGFIVALIIFFGLAADEETKVQLDDKCHAVEKTTRYVWWSDKDNHTTTTIYCKKD